MNEIRRLDLLDLILYILKQWKKILIFALVVCFVVNMLGFLKHGKKELQYKGEKSETVIRADIEAYSEIDREIYNRQEEVINVNKKLYDMYINYQNNSIKMKLNPENFYEGKVECLLNSDTKKALLRFRNKCEKKIETEEFYDKIREKTGIKIDDVYIREIIMSSFEIYEDEIGTMIVTVRYFDKKTCSDILEVIQQEMSNVTEKNSKLEIIDHYVMKTNDIELASEQSAIYGLKWSYYDKIRQVQSERTALTAKYDSDQKQEIEQIEAFSVFRVMIVFGIGIVLAIIYYMMKYLFSDLIHTKEDINGLNEVAIVTVTDENDKNKNLMENWIFKMEKRIGNVSSNSLEMDIMSIVVSLKKCNLEEICLTSSLFDEKLESEFLNNIKGVFTKYNIKVVLIKSILNDIGSLQKAMLMENVVLYEVCEQSSHKNLFNEILKLQQCGIKLRGIILEK